MARAGCGGPDRCGVFASALASLDDYVVAAASFSGGAVAGLVVIVALVGHGVVAFGWGLALERRDRRRRAARSARRARDARATGREPGRPPPGARRRRRAALCVTGLYVVGYRFANGRPGKATTLSYAYLIAATLVAVTATSIALVSTVPFARGEPTPWRVARQSARSPGSRLATVGRRRGVFALAGATVARHVLGSEYGGGTGAELGRLVVYFAPWMVASIAVTVAYPLLFVRGRARWLPLLAVGALGVHVARGVGRARDRAASPASPPGSP